MWSQFPLVSTIFGICTLIILLDDFVFKKMILLITKPFLCHLKQWMLLRVVKKVTRGTWYCSLSPLQLWCTIRGEKPFSTWDWKGIYIPYDHLMSTIQFKLTFIIILQRMRKSDSSSKRSNEEPLIKSLPVSYITRYIIYLSSTLFEPFKQSYSNSMIIRSLSMERSLEARDHV